MPRRSRAREIVLQVLYQDDLNPDTKPHVAISFLSSRRNRIELDRLLVETAENWSLERMAVTDRNVLRLGAYEIIYTKTPDRVAINEAVELAKRFGAKQSSQFVNGILDRFLHDHGKENEG